jgi:very-short-patch-repair endonuclease
MHMPDIINNALEQTRRKLLDLTNRNRLINYRESARCIAIVDELPRQVCQRLYDYRAFKFVPYEGPADRAPLSELPQAVANEESLPAKHKDGNLQTPYSAKDLKARLRKLVSDGRTILEETGANSVYLAIGFLRYREQKEGTEWQRAPLLLIPVQIERAYGGWEPGAFSLKVVDEELDTNRSLLDKLNQLSVRLPEIDKAWVGLGGEDEGSFDPEAYLTAVERALRVRAATDWRVERQMAVGVFRFQKQAMWYDLDPDRWPENAPVTQHPLVHRILLGPQGNSQPPGALPDLAHTDPAELDGHTPSLPLILNADSSQVQALHHALTVSHGVVIEGPPGTGKSQTIANLIAAAIAQGKSVLFVADKLAALEVVSNRLAQKGLGPFCLELHGLNANKKGFYERLKKRIDYAAPPPSTQIEQLTQDLDRERSRLLELSRLLSTPIGPLALPAHQVVWHIENLRHKLPAELPLHALAAPSKDRHAFLADKQLANEYTKESAGVSPDAVTAWAGFVPHTYTEQLYAAVLSALDSAIGVLADFPNAARSSELAAVLGENVALLDVLAWKKQEPAARIPGLPATTTMERVQAVLSCGTLARVREFIGACDEFLSLQAEIGPLIDLDSDNLSAEVSNSLSHITHIVDVCDTPTATLDDCEHLAARHEEIRTRLRQIEVNGEWLKGLLDKTPRRITEYESLASEAAELADTPAFIGVLAHPAHANPRTQESLNSARSRSEAIHTGLQSCEVLDPDRVDDTAALLDAINEVAGQADSWLPWLSSRYRRARKYLVARRRAHTRITRKPGCLDAMRKAHAACCERDTFKRDSEYQATLGPVFDGVATNWEQAEKVVQHATVLRNRLGQEKTRALLSDWGSSAAKIADCVEAIQSAANVVAEFKQQHGSYPVAMWHRPLRELSEALGRHQATLSKAGEFFRGERSTVATHMTFADAKRVLGTQFPRYRQLEGWLNNHRFLPLLCEASRARGMSAPTAVDAAAAWLTSITESPGIREQMLPWLIAADSTVRDSRNKLLTDIGARCSSALHGLASVLRDLGVLTPSVFFGEAPTTDDVHRKLAACRASLESLPALQRVADLRKRLVEAGMQAIPSAVEAGFIKDDQAGHWYDLAVHQGAYSAFTAQHPELQTLSNTAYEDMRTALATADKELFKATSQDIAAKAARRLAPQGNATGAVRTFSEMGLLRHQSGLQRKHLPIRRLMERASKAMQVLKPCFLMSPLSVAQYLPPGEVQFDLVVMDEASQIRPEDAIGAIARGSSCVIVGDPHQLPPTRFFDNGDGNDGADEDEQTAIVNTESILDVCLTQLPMRRLTWHYRSEHERLIQFSNSQFYNDELKVFPSPRRTSPTHGVRGTFVSTPSYRKGGYNRGEALVVVSKAIEHLRHSPGRSLGIVAMNKRQAEEIDFLLEAELRKDSYLDECVRNLDPPLFVKNLENVQGDERDIIIISTTYGPEASGKAAAQRFGPINSSVGHRRLNVVATRAKRCVELVSSLRYQDVIVSGNASKGVRALRDYLAYAFTGAVPDQGVATGRAADSPFEEAVAYHLRAMGFDCEPQIGVAGFFVDIGVKHPNRPGDFLLGVECDGAAYHSTRSARDRDRLRQEILEGKGWLIHRIWSTSWFTDRGTELRRLRVAIEHAMARDAERLEEQVEVTERSAELPSNSIAAEDLEAFLQSPVNGEMELEESLAEVLDRFWNQEIRPTFPNRRESILNPTITSLLVEHRPLTLDEFKAVIPVDARRYDARQHSFLPDILALVKEFS